MITTIDNGTIWSWFDGENICFEDGEERAITCSDVVFTTGKYVGHLLSEVSNTWYLDFIMKKNPKDYFMNFMFDRRLKELL